MTQYQGDLTCKDCGKMYAHLTGIDNCKCKKTDTGVELLGDLGLQLQHPVSHGRLSLHEVEQSQLDIYKENCNRDWTDQEKLQIILANEREIARLAEGRKVYNQPSFIGILIRGYREIRTNKDSWFCMITNQLFVFYIRWFGDIGKDFR